jgi:hypothetical protein
MNEKRWRIRWFEHDGTHYDSLVQAKRMDSAVKWAGQVVHVEDSVERGFVYFDDHARGRKP